MLAKFVPRHLVITGASSGIGRSLALEYATPGVTLGLLGRDSARLEACAVACRARGAHVVTGQLDVREEEGIKVWLNAFDDAYPIDLLIANAGAASTLASADDHEDLACITGIVGTNFYGSLNTVLPVVERMRGRGRGQLAFVCSLAALRGMAISPAYCASKAALQAYADSMRPLWARDGIALSVIFPGFVKTAMSDVFPGNKPFMWTAERAAALIRHKLAGNRAEIAFPWSLAFGMRLLTLMPARMADAILSRLSYLPRRGL
ncbi:MULTISPECIES: SDR family NAD(P)-dependent oxidoreductase [Burkholderia cepacia complex]|uniref:SDR family NAD(P)-dependent oxidoreductase n=1 Tax=Burkholderia cepacia complex TaxID=87882 RepID=UPI000D0099CD|nr:MULTISPECIES: SDR family NAD(P)-dependent oxidoreductase [Burkholderia cepacia complex]AYY96421.1 SDR family NAD(P)-dependent oxidoreductase [Burkholderia multivorans]MBF5010958.1 SDR family NAD(P)-dependent oxidoreductase [Burkholderia pseudomultivorans]MBU9120263.1 SDR family NAD(P)-dependent oxidoreductase [Burkholderia multivorans]MBU9467019.1 SDR family NAD(P)-dependent oxidoreductase [Burkholderia multivorans]MCA8128088.1 SDR family NAD(P)-dependent oxidoreductase [Burkholderia multiv